MQRPGADAAEEEGGAELVLAAERVADVAEVKFALKILAAMPDGTGAVMIDGKMQDDATWKQAKVIVDLAELIAARDPGLAHSTSQA